MVPPTPGMRVIKSGYVFKYKLDEHGRPTIPKARLVAKGYSQVEGRDYQETFAPVVRAETVRVMLALAAARDLDMFHWDVKTAFLNGTLKEDIYMDPPPGFNVGI